MQTCGRSMASANVLLNCSGPSVANTAQFSVVIPGIPRLSREVRLKYTTSTSHSPATPSPWVSIQWSVQLSIFQFSQCLNGFQIFFQDTYFIELQLLWRRRIREMSLSRGEPFQDVVRITERRDYTGDSWARACFSVVTSLSSGWFPHSADIWLSCDQRGEPRS